MNDAAKQKLTEGAARALGLSGAYRKIGANSLLVLDKASAEKWGGMHLFDPVGSSEDAFLVAGAAGLTIAFGSSYAIARPHAQVGPAVSEMYNRHADRFDAARVAVARCVILAAELQQEPA